MEASTAPADGVGTNQDDAGDASAGEERTKLARTIGPGLLLMFIVGDMLGGGIYALVGEVGAETGGAIWTAFLARPRPRASSPRSPTPSWSRSTRAPPARRSYINKAFRLPFLTFMVAFAVMASGITSASDPRPRLRRRLPLGRSSTSGRSLVGDRLPVVVALHQHARHRRVA